MIEVNLLPGGKKRPSRGPRFSFELPRVGGLPTDPWILGAAVAVLGALLAAGYLYWTVTGSLGDARSRAEGLAEDSARYADLIEQAERLAARRDSIAERVEIIQEIDQGRYVWPHIMDEVARALPEFTWLTSLTQLVGGEVVEFQIEGQAGNNFALTRFMENLEASLFIRNVTLINTELVTATEGEVSRTVSQFILEATFEPLPLEMLETVPLFDGQEDETSSSAEP